MQIYLLVDCNKYCYFFIKKKENKIPLKDQGYEVETKTNILQMMEKHRLTKNVFECFTHLTLTTI